MAIKLRQDEQIHCEAHFHWSTYIAPGFWAFLLFASVLGQLLNKTATGESIFWTLFAASFPTIYVWLRNNNKAYVVTNQRLYVEEGIISKSKVDIPFNKINDITFKQGILQRVFGSGDVCVMTGNDKPTKLSHLDEPENFREALSNVCNRKVA